MWPSAALILILTLASAQAAPLQVSNVRGVHGQFGPPRESLKLLPGDLLFLAFDITGLKPDLDNNLAFTHTLEIQDSKGKTVQPKKDLGLVKFGNLLGGTRIPQAVLVAVPFGFPADKYTIKVTLADVVGKGEGHFAQGFEVLSKDEFGLIQFQVSQDMANLVRVSNVAAVGQVVYVNVAVVGCQRDKNGEAAVAVEMSVLDDKGKPTGTKPFGDKFRIPKQAEWWPVQFDLPVTRAGQFKLVLKAKDLNDAKKSATLTLPFTAVEAK